MTPSIGAARGHDAITSPLTCSAVAQDAFNSLEGVTCNFTEGAMYSFPRLRLPEKVNLLHPCGAEGFVTDMGKPENFALNAEGLCLVRRRRSHVLARPCLPTCGSRT